MAFLEIWGWTSKLSSFSFNPRPTVIVLKRRTWDEASFFFPTIFFFFFSFLPTCYIDSGSESSVSANHGQPTATNHERYNVQITHQLTHRQAGITSPFRRVPGLIESLAYSNN
jgi:hypothetical protein